MAVLPDTDRASLWSEFMDEMSRDRVPVGITKADLRAAVNAIDNWIDLNRASFQAALPEPAASVLTAKQKLRLFMAVARKRWEVT